MSNELCIGCQIVLPSQHNVVCVSCEMPFCEKCGIANFTHEGHVDSFQPATSDAGSEEGSGIAICFSCSASTFEHNYQRSFGLPDPEAGMPRESPYVFSGVGEESDSEDYSDDEDEPIASTPQSYVSSQQQSQAPVSTWSPSESDPSKEEETMSDVC